MKKPQSEQKHASESIFTHFALITSIVYLLSPTGLQAGLYVETFDGGDQGWQYGYGPQYTVGSTYHSPSGGAPDSHIYGTANDLYAIWIDSWGATDSLIPYGDMTGLMLSIDTKSIGTTTGTAQIYVGKDGTYFVGTQTWDISLDTAWTTHTATFNDTDFERWQSNTTLTLEEVIQAPDDMGIFFGSSTVAADETSQIHVDNFGAKIAPVAIPEPSTGVILTFIAAILVFRRKKGQ